MLRGFDFDRGLRWVGLARRTGPFHDLAVFSLGLAVGAGAGLLLAPVSGADARRAILDQVKGLKQDAKQTFDAAERKVETKVAEGADAFKDKVDAAADAVKDKTDAVKDKLDATADAVKDKVESMADAKNDADKSVAYPRPRSTTDTSNRASSLSGPGDRHRIS
jgi:gas vesicle protein